MLIFCLFRTFYLQMKVRIIKTPVFLLLLLFFVAGSMQRAQAQYRRLYDTLCVYVCAHQDDWQLFMGTNVYNDILSFNEITPDKNGRKVVIIYTTAGNLNDTDDSRSCDCKDPYNAGAGGVPYWKVREEGSKHSLHLASCRIGGWGPGIPYPANKTVTINGHRITRYDYKNTASYYLRLKTGAYGQWYYNLNASIGTVDSSTEYRDWNDFVNTLYYIYESEMDSSLDRRTIAFNCQDVNETINPNDHHDHYIAGRAGCEAAKLMANNKATWYPLNLFEDYNSQNKPANLPARDAGNESALVGAYCLALLDYNAWPEWGNVYADWASRNYMRTITTNEDPTAANLMNQDSLTQQNVDVYPVPADKTLNIRFRLPPASAISIAVYDSHGASVLNFSGIVSSNVFSVNTSMLPDGSYMVKISQPGNILTNSYFQVLH